jgi:hypothetical protein
MKTYFIALVTSLIASCAPVVSYAGAPNCTSVRHIIASGNVTVSASDCIISIEKTVFEDTTVNLPSDASAGDEITVISATSYELDQCEMYYDDYLERDVTICWPGSIYVLAGEALIDGSNVFGMAGMYDILAPSRQTIKFTFGGVNWTSDYEY